MTTLHVTAATADHLTHAKALVFEYMAATQLERARPAPTGPEQLPDVLRAEHADLATTYRAPGAMLIAYDRGRGLDRPVGCVGLKPIRETSTIEVKRLYVRPAHRRAGAARALMDAARRHSADHGFTRMILDVMPSRTHVVDFYRRLGFVEAEPHPAESTDSMIYLQRLLTHP